MSVRRLAAAALLSVLVAGPALAISDPRELLPDPKQEARAEELGSQLRCLVCQNESIEESGADLARDLRGIVRQQISQGKSDKEIMDWMVARYGTFVRLSPPLTAATVLLWATPALALLAGFGAVLLGRRRVPAPPAALTDAEQLRLAELSRQA